MTDSSASLPQVASERAKPVPVGEKLEKLRSAVQSAIQQEGAFPITTATGMFRASA